MCVSITWSGIARRLSCRAVQNKASCFQKMGSKIKSNKGLQPFQFYLTAKISLFFLESIHASTTTLCTTAAVVCSSHILIAQIQGKLPIFNTSGLLLLLPLESALLKLLGDMPPLLPVSSPKDTYKYT